MKSSYINFDGKKIFISHDLREVFDFLIEIKKEVNSFLEREEQSEKIRKQLLKFIDSAQEHNIDFNFEMSESIKIISNKLKVHRSPRSELIILFAYLETLRCLWVAYDFKTSEREKLRNASDEKIDIFFKEFCLCKKNKWVRNNSKRSGKIGAKRLRELRNSLTHFFSISKLGIVTSGSEDDIQKVGKMTNNRVQAITPKDLSEITAGVFEILIKKWSDDCKESLDNGHLDFKERIKCVNVLVEDCGAKILYRNNQ